VLAIYAVALHVILLGLVPIAANGEIVNPLKRSRKEAIRFSNSWSLGLWLPRVQFAALIELIATGIRPIEFRDWRDLWKRLVPWYQ
jgi:hypothetical protein